MNIINKPKISVVIPCYNAENYIQETIDSVLNQSFNDYELIIVNDGSTDRTIDVLTKNKKCSKKISVINIENSGVSKAFFAGIEVARSEFIARIDADDLMLKHRLEHQYDYLCKNRELDLIGTWIKKFSGKKKYNLIERFPLSPFVTKNFMCLFNQIANPTTLMKKKLYQKYIPDDLKIGEDLSFWLNLISDNYNIGNMPVALTKYRIHENQATANRNTTNVFTNQVYENNIANLIQSSNVEEAFVKFGILFRKGIDIKETSSFFHEYINVLRKEELRYGNLDALSDCLFRVYNNSTGNKIDKMRYIIIDFYKFSLNLNIIEKMIKFSNNI